ncbi:hypothetical protein M422DRAFT_70387 [Sphaerobolus stellatus SS14]|uniref:KOW domain-containing protein n=1 Tax=Sphaerobolus stellatus (strain SS14) TaxID=990650 RepID=A0A0C9TTE3_SPHS4|nr:hypothetical protein M422DRAFT_70387 [Sphaerobolus stellatus SS14]
MEENDRLKQVREIIRIGEARRQVKNLPIGTITSRALQQDFNTVKNDPDRLVAMPEPSTFKRFVEVGRLVLLRAGPYEGKVAVIVEIIDHKRAIIDGPTTGVPRQSFPYRHLVLTPLTLKKLPRGGRSGVVKKFIESQELIQKWEKSSWAQKLETVKQRKSLSDFDRFNIQVLKKNRRHNVRIALAKAKATKA